MHMMRRQAYCITAGSVEKREQKKRRNAMTGAMSTALNKTE